MPSLSRLARPLVVAAVLLSCALLWRDLDFAALGDALARAAWPLVALAALLNLSLNLWARVRRWRSVLDPLPHHGPGPGLFDLAKLHLASSAASNLLPARAGEALRTYALRRHGYPLEGLVAAHLFEKIVEAASIGLVALLLLAFSPVPSALLWPIGLCAVAALAGPAFIAALAWRARPGARRDPSSPTSGLFARLLRFLSRIPGSVRRLHSRETWGRALFWSCVSDLVDLAMIALCFVAVGIPCDPAACVTVFLAVNAAIAVPATPGQIGLFEAAAVLALGAFGAEPPRALSFALLYHAAHVLPVTALGLAGMRPFLRASERKTA
jgi:uncharacterized protein (TIRG00374 family)